MENPLLDLLPIQETSLVFSGYLLFRENPCLESGRNDYFARRGRLTNVETAVAD
jgi:hypothetical protein